MRGFSDGETSFVELDKIRSGIFRFVVEIAERNKRTQAGSINEDSDAPREWG